MKKRLSVILVFVLVLNMLLGAFGEITISAPVTLIKEVDLPGTTSETEFTMDNSGDNIITVNYTLRPERISASNIPLEYSNKEIVIVIDKSGSMGTAIGGGSNKSRMAVVKDAAKRFVESMKVYPKVKVSIIYYSNIAEVFTYGSKALLNLSNTNEYNALINEINSINPFGGTNLGDGIRRASYVLSNNNGAEKYMIFMTDGLPTAFSVTSLSRSGSGAGEYYYQGGRKAAHSVWNVNYKYTDGNASKYFVNWGAGDIGSYSVNYAKEMTRTLGESVSSYFIGFSDVAASTKLREISEVITSVYKQAITADDIDSVYSDIAKEIKADVKLTNVNFEDEILDDLEVIESTLPEGMTIQNNKLVKTFGDIIYELNSAKTYYTADEINFSVQYKVLKSGIFNLGQNNTSKFTYTDINENNVTKPFSVVTFTAKRLPITGLTSDRDLNKNENTVIWDTYDGASGYKVYKDGILIATLVGENSTSVVLQIEDNDGSTENITVVAILPGDLSSPSTTTINTIPSILNLKVDREGDKFTLSWDLIPGVTEYTIKPMIKTTGAYVDEDVISLSPNTIVTLGNRVQYEYTVPAGNYTIENKIKFLVDGAKGATPVNEAMTNSFALIEIINTTISNLENFKYKDSNSIEIEFNPAELGGLSFPTNIYNPVYVLELDKNQMTNNLRLEYTYSTINIQVGDGTDYTKIDGTVTRSVDGAVIIYVDALDLDRDGIIDNVLKDYSVKLNVEFGVNFESENGILKEAVMTKINGFIGETSTHKLFGEIKAWEISNYIEGILTKGYDIDKKDTLLKVKSYIYYNESNKDVFTPSIRDSKVGIESKFIKLRNTNIIDNEF